MVAAAFTASVSVVVTAAVVPRRASVPDVGTCASYVPATHSACRCMLLVQHSATCLSHTHFVADCAVLGHLHRSPPCWMLTLDRFVSCTVTRRGYFTLLTVTKTHLLGSAPVQLKFSLTK